ncbi:MAG: hypothetical protein AMXMBFR12_10140 [Candidatus Babeliales bacterium]
MHISSLKYFLITVLCCVFIYSLSYTDNENSIPSHLEKTQQQMIRNACDMSLLSPNLARCIFENAPQGFKDLVAIIKEAQSRYGTFYDSNYYRTIMPSRILLVGAPGVGKSTLARLMAQELGRELIFVKAPMLGTEYQNSEIVNLTQIFEAAFTATRAVILVLDEINILAEPRKNQGNNDASVASALWLLLDKCLDYPHILVVGTCNDATKIPDQLKDRFLGNILYIPTSTEQERFTILKSCCDARELFYEEDVLRTYVVKTHGYSVRQLQALIAIAHKLSFIERQGYAFLSKEILEKALSQMEYEKRLMCYKRKDILRWMEENSYLLPWVTLGAQAVLLTASTLYYLLKTKIEPIGVV